MRRVAFIMAVKTAMPLDVKCFRIIGFIRSMPADFLLGILLIIFFISVGEV